MKLEIVTKSGVSAVNNSRDTSNYEVEKNTIINSFVALNNHKDMSEDDLYELRSILGHYNDLLDAVNMAKVDENHSGGDSCPAKYDNAVSDWMECETLESLCVLNYALQEIKEYFILKNDNTRATHIDNAFELVNRIFLCERKESQE